MRIGVMSDTHGDLACWQGITEGIFCDVDLIVHAGDIFYHGVRNPLPDGYNTPALAEAINELKTPLLVCRGNCDSDVDQLVVDVPIQAPCLVCQFDYLRLFVHHGHLFSDEEVQRLTSRWKVAVCISGHTHIPFLGQKDSTVFLNPGSPALPKGGNSPTVAIIDTNGVPASPGKITLYDCQNSNIIKSFTLVA
jgi:putative phosphoesterase